MKKRKTQTKKPSIARILGYVLLGLVVVGVVANVINELPKEEDPIEELQPGDEGPEVLTATISGLSEDIVINFENGMTWKDFIISDYNTFGFSLNGDEDIVSYDLNESVDVVTGSPGSGYLTGDDIILPGTYSFIMP